jgi:predicted HAD superfamily phosphohydrolase YqeG
MKILFDLGLNLSMIDSIKKQIKQIENENYDDYFVKTLVLEISNTIVEIQFNYESDEVFVREC